MCTKWMIMIWFENHRVDFFPRWLLCKRNMYIVHMHRTCLQFHCVLSSACVCVFFSFPFLWFLFRSLFFIWCAPVCSWRKRTALACHARTMLYLYWKVNWMVVVGGEGNRLHGQSTASHVRSQCIKQLDAISGFSVILLLFFRVISHYISSSFSFTFHRSFGISHSIRLLVSLWLLAVIASDSKRRISLIPSDWTSGIAEKWDEENKNQIRVGIVL